MIQRLFGIASKHPYQREKPVRDPAYKRFIKRLPCLACGKTWGVDPCHTGPHATAQKASDLKCIPLCRKCHDQFDSNPQDFAVVHQLDIEASIGLFNHLWSLKLRGRAA